MKKFLFFLTLLTVSLLPASTVYASTYCYVI